MAQKDPDPLFILRASSPITSLSFSFLNSVEVLITGSQNGLIEVWNLSTKRTMLHVLTDAHEILYANIIHSEDFYLVGHNRSGLVQFFKIEDSKFCLQHSLLVHNVGFASINFLKEKGMVMKCILFIRDCILYLICAYEDGSVCLWNVFESSMLHREKVYEDPVMSMDTDGRKIITASTGNKIHFYNIDENFHLIQINEYETMSSGYSVLSIRSDKKIVACGSWNGVVRLYSWKKMKLLAILKYHNKGISSIVYSSGNIIGIAARDGKISIWDVYKNT
ncbi:guanine nucleotide-binding protein subunit beta-like protein 1 isoform X3 [Hydra vulgaris]|uniref:guanine nucleotide-binding protein subunit beta-like protein 1 isoform X3 n=1 Tax=Hydra vulgaris TaxID=6087 RepID=UPI001F5ECF01|nr:guanine nucleotide-binding protein subunit beta-like protein 1 isoform X4 [Hydra vulgaris]